MTKRKKLAVLGAGKLGETLISGMLDVGVISRDRIVATAKHTERLNALKAKYRIGVTTNNRKAVKGASVVLLAVKPQAVQELLEEIRGHSRPSGDFRRGFGHHGFPGAQPGRSNSGHSRHAQYALSGAFRNDCFVQRSLCRGAAAEGGAADV